MLKDLKYKGFSLVEVMILFTLLSVIMAASMTMISKKSSPVPPKVSHGMYRCIYTPGGLIEEEYTATDQLYSRPLGGNQCSFRVPKAAMYKIDMYSAGSGGTEYAVIDSTVDANSSDVTYTLDNLTPEFVNAQTDQLYIPSNIEFYEMLHGKYLVSSVFTGDAGSGGGVYVTYPSVTDVSCLSEEHQSLMETDTSDLEAQLEIVKNFKKEDILNHLVIPSDNTYWNTPTQLRFVLPADNDSALIYTPPANDMAGGFRRLYDREDAIYIFYHQLTGVGETLDYWQPFSHAFSYLADMFEASYNNDPEYFRSVSGPMFSDTILMYESPEFGNMSYISSVSARVFDVYYHKSLLLEADSEPVFNEYDNINNNVYTFRMHYGDDYYNNNSPMCTWTPYYKNHFNVNPSVACGIRLRPAIDQILDELKMVVQWDLERQIKEAGYKDIKDVPEFAALYNNQSVMNDQVKKQIRDYCKMEFKPIYKSLGIFNNDTKIDEEIQYGKRRVISTLGGNEGLGKLSTMVYKLSSSRFYIGGGNFMNYASNVKQNYLTPVYCDKNAKNCTQPPNSDCPTFWNFFSQANVGCTKKGTDTNLASNVNYNSLSTSITQNDVKIAHYSPSNNDDFGPPIVDGRYVITEDGKAPEKIPAWQSGDIITHLTVSKLPEGGKAPKVHIKLGYQDYNRTSVCDFTAWTCPKKDDTDLYILMYLLGDEWAVTASSGGTGSSDIRWRMSEFYKPFYEAHINNNGVIFNKNVADTAMIDSIGTSSNATGYEESGNNYKIISSDGITYDTPVESLNPSTFPMFQEPFITAKSWKWKKSYSLGGPGNPGNFVSLTGTDLGTNCTLRVPAPGEVYRLGVDDPFVLKEKLSASIACRNNQGQVVFDHTVSGNDYNESLVSGADKINNATYTWLPNINEDGDKFEVRLKDNPEPPNWRPTSVLSVLINKFFRHESGDYDIKATYGIGAPGPGTRLDDYCLVRKGKYQREVFYNIKYNDSSDNITTRRNNSKTGCEYLLQGDPACDLSSTYSYPITSLLEKNVKIEGSEKNVYSDGNYKGYNCYGEDAAGQDATEGHWDLRSDSPIVQKGLIDIKADNGGGGAIVISW